MVDRRSFISAMGMAGLQSLLPLTISSLEGQAEIRSQSNSVKSRNGIQFTTNSFVIDGQKKFLISAEMHYFRVPKNDWRRRMELFKDTGGNCLSTYIPWAVHEPQESNFLFETGDGLHDLEAFLETANREGLYVIARPGPYIGSELKYGGLPAWLCENYPQIQASGIDGKSLGMSSISYLHPTYLTKVKNWFEHVCPLIAKHTIQKGGPVAMLQLDNELMGFHIWRGSLDYSREGMGIGRTNGRYSSFLGTRYNSIADMNAAYATQFNSFEAATPILPALCSNLHDLRRAKDYLEFYLHVVSEYAGFLARLVREQGIEVPLIHNSAGPDMNALFLETVLMQSSTFLLGTDHYYNLGQDWGPDNPTPQSAVNLFCSLEMLRLMGYPPTVLELQGGSPFDWPPIQANDCAAWYWTNLAYGMKGSNYYIFTGGDNPPGLGETSDNYDYGAAIGAKGEIRPLYSVQTRFNHCLNEHPWLAESKRECDFRVAFDFDAPRANQYWTYRNDQIFSYPAAWEFMRKGLLTSAFCGSLSPMFCNLASDDWLNGEQLPLFVPASSCMASAKQERIVRFLKAKGSVLIAPILPTYDDEFQPSTILADFLGKPVIRNERRELVRIKIAGIQNIVSNGTVFTTTIVPAHAEVLGVDESSGGVVAWQLETEGGGRVIFLGMSWVHAMRAHQDLVETLLGRLDLRPKIACSNPAVWTSLRTHGDRSALFLMNLFSCPAELDVACHVGSDEAMRQLGHHSLAPMSVKFIEL